MKVECTRIYSDENPAFVHAVIVLSQDEPGQERLSEKRNILLLTEFLTELKLKKGILTEQAFDVLESAGHQSLAVRQALRFLSYSSHSKRELFFKLRQKKIDQESAQFAVSYAEEKGWINDSFEAARVAEKCVKKGWGLNRIRSYLFTKGFEDSVIYGVCQDLAETVDFSANCRELLGKKGVLKPTDAKELSKTFRTGKQYGYSSEEIRKALKKE